MKTGGGKKLLLFFQLFSKSKIKKTQFSSLRHLQNAEGNALWCILFTINHFQMPYRIFPS